MLTKINNKQEMIEFIKSKRSDFGCVESWKEWFDVALKFDHKTGDDLEIIDEYFKNGGTANIPSDNDYPAIVAYINEGNESMLRCGEVVIQAYDWLSVNW